jgi:pimeloyl-ACP methyl ester carboxylesterase
VRWRGVHGYGSSRSRGLSFGSAGRTVNVWRISLGRLREGTSGVYRILALNGGIAREPRRRAAGAPRLEEREEISRGIAAGRSMRRIAQDLRRSPSTVSREIRRNGGCSAYRAGEADRRAWERALRPQSCRRARHAKLRWRVAQKLALQWSPEQISGWLKRQFPADQGMQVSHETIYRSLFIQTRGVLKKQLMAASADGAADASSQRRRRGAIERDNTLFMADHIPGSGLLIEPQVRHFAFLQDPEQFNAAVLNFLAHVKGQ